ncbi:MAG: hypothetical protein ACXW2F_08980 [Thermoanaerobaculia bacterium]
MAVRGDDVASSIDTHVRQAVERMVGEIRSSIEDVRVAVDDQLKAALQSMQADVNSLTFLPHIKKTVGELEETYAASKPAAAGGGDASRIRTAIQAVEAGKSQVDVLNALLEQCLHFGSRAALLILRGETFSGWKGVGFGAHGGNDESIKKFNAAPGVVSELDTVLRQEHVVIWDGASLSSRFGARTADRAMIVPMVIKDKVSAAVYVDALGNDVAKLDPSSVELLVFTTGLLIDTLAIRKKIPSPSLTEGGQAAAKPAAVAPPPRPSQNPMIERPSERAAAPPPPSRPVSAPTAPPAPVKGAESTVAISSQQIRDMMASQTSLSPAAAKEYQPRPVPPPPPTPRPATPPPAAQPLGEDKPSTQFVPRPGIQRGGAFGEGQTDDVKRHDEARRFARLLVSEIKLYNEAKVDQGRKNKDLYDRLKDEIDRSRQMYDERIHEDVRKTSNYFYDELVRILADGNADSLGL